MDLIETTSLIQTHFPNLKSKQFKIKVDDKSRVRSVVFTLNTLTHYNYTTLIIYFHLPGTYKKFKVSFKADYIHGQTKLQNRIYTYSDTFEDAVKNFRIMVSRFNNSISPLM